MKNTNRNYNQMIKGICDKLKIEIQTFSHDWIFELTKKDQHRFIVGYQFDLNTGPSQKICVDKSATSEILIQHHIKAIPHHFILNDKELNFIDIKDNREYLKDLFDRYQKIVIKPNEGYNGQDVFLVETISDLTKKVASLFQKHRSLALSPYIAIEKEYRVIILDNEILLTYSKETKNFKHNLGEGAIPVLVNDPKLLDALSLIAFDVSKVLNLRFASIDIVKHEDQLSVLEVNSGVMLEHFSRINDDFYHIAKDIYQKAIKKMFQ